MNVAKYTSSMIRGFCFLYNVIWFGLGFFVLERVINAHWIITLIYAISGMFWVVLYVPNK